MLKDLLAVISPVFAFMSSHFSGSLLISYLSHKEQRKSINDRNTLLVRVTFFLCGSIAPQFRMIGVKGDVAFQRSPREHRLRDHDLYGVLPEMWRFILIHNGHHHSGSAHWDIGSLVAQRFKIFHRQKQHILVLCFKIQRLRDKIERKIRKKSLHIIYIYMYIYT